MLREYGRSALITQTITAGESSIHEAPFLSTIADAILTLEEVQALSAEDQTSCDRSCRRSCRSCSKRR